jgi:hypothetical protein
MMSLRYVFSVVGLLAGVWVTLGAQSPPNVWAIVGARLVDGSGNEPFTGTVIVEGGRIRAAGRSVEVPADAATIDGTGCTVLPGLIDLGVHVAPGTDRAASDQQRRAIAALLYAGVTTVAVAGPDDSHFSALQSDAGRADLGPRLAFLPQGGEPPGIADAAGSKTSPARSGIDAAAAASHAPALAQANITVLPERTRLAPVEGTLAALAGEVAAVAGVDASDAPVQEDVTRLSSTIRALLDGRVRLAVRSDAGLPGRAYGWSTHRVVQQLVEAGLTPLQAVTAATSGGAWALQVHSDRGFIVAGMRADLLVVQGDPTTDIAALSRIDRVFLGGREVDRASLRSRLAPPPAPPPTATVESTVAPAKTPAKTTAEKPRAARRGGKRAPAAEVKTAPEAATSVEAGVVAEARPESGAATPRSDLAPVPISDPLLDDFERGDERSAIGLPWATAGEPGGGSTAVVAGRVIRAFRDHAMLLTARLGEGATPFMRATLPLSADGRPRDVSRFRGLRFDARGEGRYRIVFVTRSVTDGRFHVSYFSGSPLWTPVSVPFATAGQNGTGERIRWSGRDLVEIRFEAARDAGSMAWLELDNIRFY